MAKAHKERQFFRLEYPSTERPQLLIARSSYPVVDISEAGLRFCVRGLHSFKAKQVVDATLKCGARINHQLKATVIRVDKEHIILHILPSLPLTLIMAEQRYLIATYGSFKT